MQVEDLVIIGAGPAGIATALQLKRYGIEPLIFEKDSVGGLLKNAHLVENYPGFPGGISGEELVALLQRQTKAFSLVIRFEEVLELDVTGQFFRLQTGRNLYHAGTIVVASGTKPVKFSGIDIPEGASSRIFYEIFPIREVKRQTIAVVGAGDVAFDYALNLSRNNDVIILNRSNRIKALPLLWKRAVASPRIRYEDDVTLLEIVPIATDGLILHYRNPEQVQRLYLNYLVFAIGREPQLDFVSQRLSEKKNNLYFCGDVINGRFRQTAIAVGDGIKTAMAIYRELQEK